MVRSTFPPTHFNAPTPSTKRTQWTHLYHPLVVISGIPPILGNLGIRAGFETLDPPLSAVELTAAGEETRSAPQGAADSLDLGGRLVEAHGGGARAADAGLGGREEGLQRLQERAEELLDRGAVRYVHLGEGVGAIVAEHQACLRVHVCWVSQVLPGAICTSEVSQTYTRRYTHTQRTRARVVWDEG